MYYSRYLLPPPPPPPPTSKAKEAGWRCTKKKATTSALPKICFSSTFRLISLRATTGQHEFFLPLVISSKKSLFSSEKNMKGGHKCGVAFSSCHFSFVKRRRRRVLCSRFLQQTELYGEFGVGLLLRRDFLGKRQQTDMSALRRGGERENRPRPPLRYGRLSQQKTSFSWERRPFSLCCRLSTFSHGNESRKRKKWNKN